MQAENLEQTAWALASRTTGLTPAGLAGLIGAGELVRTHVLRPTWHLVHRDDARWLVELTAPRIRRMTVRQLERDLDLPPVRVDLLADAVEEVVTRRPDLPRDELAAELRAAGHPLTGMQLMVLLLVVELDLRVGSGRPVPDGGTGTHTYAPLAGRLPPSPHPDRTAALAALARRYVTGHGPVTERDLAYWATLPLGDVRAGLAAAAGDLERFEHDGRTFWHAPGEEPPQPSPRPRVHLIHLLDEWYRGLPGLAAGRRHRGAPPGRPRALASGCSSSTPRSPAPCAAPPGPAGSTSRSAPTVR